MSMVTSKHFKRIIAESINKIISENNLHVIENKILVLNNQLNELDKEDARIKHKIDYFKNIAKTVPEEAHMVQGDIDSLTQQLIDIRNKKEPIRAEIKELKKQYAYILSPDRLKKKAKLINEPSEEPAPKPIRNKEISDNRKKSALELGQMAWKKKWEGIYNRIMTDGYILINKGAEVLLLSGGRTKTKSLHPMVSQLKNYLAKEHPDKKVKYSFIKRKRRDWRQLDDIEYFDLKLTIVDNNAISFSPDDVPYDTSNY